MKYKFTNCNCELELDETGVPIIDYDEVLDKFIDCPATWALIGTGNTKSIFQLESQLGQSNAKKLKPENIEQLSALISILRPGCLEVFRDGKNVTQHYIDRKNGIEDATYYHPALEPILKKTYGEMIYQEQAMQIAKDIAGFTLQEADELRKCVAKGSWIMTQNGPRKIEEITKKSKILTTNQKGKLVYLPIKKCWSSGIQPVYEIRSNSGYRIQLTKQHQIFTQRGWIEVKNLKLTDLIVIPKQYIYKGYNHLNLTKEHAILLAYQIGEGCYCSTSEPKITNKDPWVLNLIRKIIDNLFGKNNYIEYKHTNQCFDIYLKGNAKNFIKTVLNKCKSKQKTIPTCILNNTDGINQAFIGSYFTAEGSVNKTNLEIDSTSIEIAENLQLMLLRDGIHSSLHTKNSTYNNKPYLSYRVCISSLSNIKKFILQYKNYICPTKLQKIEIITKNNKCCNERFLVPSLFIKCVTQNINLNSIMGSPYCCGSLYTQNLTYDKARLLNSYIDSELLTDILDAEYQFTTIKSIEYKQDIETYDFEIDDNKNHFGFINGILVHNSIGKKLPELMAKVKIKFIDGCKKQGVVTDEEAAVIFDAIQKSQRYFFNKSHAVSYALDAYLSAWVKAHFSNEYLTSCLGHAKQCTKPFEEIQEICQNARIMDIDILPPDLCKGNTKFKLIDGKIYFGIGNIKHVGQSILHALLQRLSAVHTHLGIPNNCQLTWIEFLIYITPYVNSTAIRALICSGALSYFLIPRTQMMYEYIRYDKLSQREKDWVEKRYFINKFKTLENILTSMLTAPTGKMGACANKNRYSIIQTLLQELKNPPYALKDSSEWKAQEEAELLGIAITCSSLDDKDTAGANITCKDFLNGKHLPEILCLAAKIDRFNETKTKKGKSPGQLMAFLTVSDNTSQIGSVVAFPSVWKEFKSLLVLNNDIILIGKKDKDTFILNKVLQI